MILALLEESACSIGILECNGGNCNGGSDSRFYVTSDRRPDATQMSNR